ncbi:MAG: carboxypeptidase-like regulatory domain-containing protein, partial [Solirubrobacteraceae bacterium]|nr:carboxypeptidase-like regulatory domain-containing protein [Solirubrobacteraceae bacterium]
PVKATTPDAAGRFVLYPVPAGDYDLVVRAAGRATAVLTGVPVSSSTPTTINAAGQPINPPASGMRAVSGSVTPASATVRALQGLANGAAIEVAWAEVDAVSGTFGFSLPVGAPVRGAYAANGQAPLFTPDTAAAANYTLEAAANGALQTRTINVGTNVPAITFTFP